MSVKLARSLAVAVAVTAMLSACGSGDEFQDKCVDHIEKYITAGKSIEIVEFARINSENFGYLARETDRRTASRRSELKKLDCIGDGGLLADRPECRTEKDFTMSAFLELQRSCERSFEAGCAMISYRFDDEAEGALPHEALCTYTPYMGTVDAKPVLEAP